MKVNVWGVTGGLIALWIADAIYMAEHQHAITWLLKAMLKDSFSYAAGVLALWLSVKETPDAE